MRRADDVLVTPRAVEVYVSRPVEVGGSGELVQGTRPPAPVEPPS